MNKFNQLLESEEVIKKLHSELDDATAKQNKILEGISIEDIKSCTYEEFEAIFPFFQYGHEEKDVEVRKIYQMKKLERYPILRGVYHLPELMELKDKFSEELLKAVDEVLYHTGFSEYLMQDSDTKYCERIFDYKSLLLGLNYKFKLSNDEWFVLLDFLKEKGIVKYKYNLYDEESRCKSDLITDKEYELYKENIGNFSEDEYYRILLYNDNDDDSYERVCTREGFEKLKKKIMIRLCKRGISEMEAIKGELK